MKKTLLAVLLFACSFATAQTSYTVSGTAPNVDVIFSGTVSGTYRVVDGRFLSCEDPQVYIEESRTTPSGTVLTGRDYYYTTYVANSNGDYLNATWIVHDDQGRVIDNVTPGATNDYGDHGEFTYSLPSHYEQVGSYIRLTYTDRCGTYTYDHYIGTSSSRYGDRMKPPKIRRPVI